MTPISIPSPPCEQCWGCCCRSIRQVIVELDESELPDHPEAIQVDEGDGDTNWGIPAIAGKCPHLTDQGRCSIYERRPWLCRDYNCLEGFRADRQTSSFMLQDNPELVELFVRERPQYVVDVLTERIDHDRQSICSDPESPSR